MRRSVAFSPTAYSATKSTSRATVAPTLATKCTACTASSSTGPMHTRRPQRLKSDENVSLTCPPSSSDPTLLWHRSAHALLRLARCHSCFDRYETWFIALGDVSGGTPQYANTSASHRFRRYYFSTEYAR